MIGNTEVGPYCIELLFTYYAIIYVDAIKKNYFIIILCYIINQLMFLYLSAILIEKLWLNYFVYLRDNFNKQSAFYFDALIKLVLDEGKH